MAIAATTPIATPGFATMVTPAPLAVERGAVATGGWWLAGSLEMLFVGLLVPIAILIVGAPFALLARAIIELASRF